MYLANLVDGFHIYADEGNIKYTEILLKCQDIPNPSVSVTIPESGRSCLFHIGSISLAYGFSWTDA